MAKRTSKTSHVLNLITNGEPDMPAEKEKPAAQRESDAGKPADAKVTVVDTEEERSQVSEEVQKQLLNQLEKEASAPESDVTEAKPQEAPAPQPVVTEAKPQEAPAPQPTVAEAKPQEAPAPQPVVAEAKPQEAPAPQPTVAEAKPQEAPAPQPTVTEVKEPEVSYDRVNVMEKLLERTDVKKHMKDYGVCTCSRCCADVRALVLTRLPAKYVVTEKEAISPMISYYEAKYRMRVLTEMIKSCIDVRDNPRH